MANLEWRLKKLEALRIDSSGFTPRSPEWFEHWYETEGRVDAVDAGSTITLSTVVAAAFEACCNRAVDWP